MISYDICLTMRLGIFEHKVEPFCEWIQCLGFIWHLLVTYWHIPPLVQMEYLLEKLTSSMKWRIIPVAVQIKK